MADFQAVIARYEEDVSWTQKLPFPFIVYNKGESPTGLEGSHVVIKKQNVGRESETYLSHIIEHYDALPQYLLLLQGNPFDHCRGIIEVLKNPPTFDFVLPLAGNTKHESLTQEYNWPGFKECLVRIASGLGIKSDGTLIYGTGAQYIVPRNAILARPKEFYKMLREKVATEINPLEGWAMERLWGYVFGYKNRTDDLTLDTITPGGQEDLFRAQDLVCVQTDPDIFTKDGLKAAADIFYLKKYSVATEEDPCVFFDGGFLTHKNILLLYWRDTLLPPEPEFFQALGVPVAFTRSG